MEERRNCVMWWMEDPGSRKVGCFGEGESVGRRGVWKGGRGSDRQATSATLLQALDYCPSNLKSRGDLSPRVKSPARARALIVDTFHVAL